MPIRMVLSNDFYYDGILRARYFWATPNYAGAFLATFIPCFWWLRSLWDKGRPSHHFAFVIVLVLEFLVWYFLFATLSRGALVAVAAGCFYYFGFTQLAIIRKRIAPPSKTRKIILVVFCIGVIFAAYASRILERTETIWAGDASVENRTELWATCTEMIASEPWRGFGSSQSGQIYCNWYQNPHRHEYYATPVNSYLDIGAERGLPLLALVLLILCAYLFLRFPPSLGPTAWSVIQASKAALLTWATANLFSTLWVVPSLWSIPLVGMIALSVLAISRINRRDLVVSLVASGCMAMAICIAVYQFGHARLDARYHQVRCFRNGAVEIRRRDTNENTSIVAYLDESVLGLMPGREFRAWLRASDEIAMAYVQPTTSPGLSLPDGIDQLLLFGAHASRIQEIDRPIIVHIVHPIGRPPKGAIDLKGSIIVLHLPSIDDVGSSASWVSWARDKNVRIEITQESGTDIRSVWPDALRL